MHRQRPSHNPSKNLSQNEIQCLYDLLGDNCVTLATAVTQIFYACDHVWKKQACGILCYVKDYNRRVYCFRLYNLRSKESIYEEITSVSLSLEKVLDLFYTFDGTKCKVGINFVDQLEAETFCKHFHKKQADRRRKMEIQQSKNTTVLPMKNRIKLTSNGTLKIFTSPPTTTEQTNWKKSKHGKKKHRPVISEPVRTSFQHVIHVGHNSSFLIDATKKQLFDEVLDSMHISPEEKSYIRSTISNTNNGLEQYFTKSIRDGNTQEQQMSNLPPAVPPRTTTTRKDISLPSTSLNPPQLQNTSKTSSDSKQSKAPIVSPEPIRPASNDTLKSIKTRRAPPPPIPTSSQTASLPAPPPPPPLPADLFNLKENISIPPSTPNDSSASSSNTEPSSLLKGIMTFNKEQLRPASQRPTPVIEAQLDEHLTMEEFIAGMLDKRRREIMPDNDSDDESDSSDDEWTDQ